MNQWRERPPRAWEYIAAFAVCLLVYVAVVLADFMVLASLYLAETGAAGIPVTYSVLASVVSVYMAHTTATAAHTALINRAERRLARQEATHA